MSNVFGDNDYKKAAEGATRKNVFDCLYKSFNNYGIPLKNIIGFGSDECNATIGAHNSIASRMIQHFQGITIWTCICHSLHLCASETCKSLPKRCKNLAHNVMFIRIFL